MDQRQIDRAVGQVARGVIPSPDRFHLHEAKTLS
jgi:hypothetical protein